MTQMVILYDSNGGSLEVSYWFPLQNEFGYNIFSSKLIIYSARVYLNLNVLQFVKKKIAFDDRKKLKSYNWYPVVFYNKKKYFASK